MDANMIFTVDMLPEIRKQMKEMMKDMPIFGKEITVPTRAGQTRCLVYKPEHRQGPSPVFFNVHGGGFVMGDPEGDDFMCKKFRDALDITVINVEYRLAPETKWPGDKEDVYDVVKYVVDHADEFGIDPNCMAIGGHSAGANISTVVCMMGRETGDFSFKCQILDYPPLDLLKDPFAKFYTEGAIPPEVADMFNKAYCSDPAETGQVYCSPVYAEVDFLKGMPPAVILTCEIDSLRDEGEEYGKKLAQAGVEVTMKRFLGVAHGFTSDPMNPLADAGHQMMIEGLRKYLL